MKSRTPSDSAIVAIFRGKRKPQNAVRSAFPLDFMGIFNDMAAVWAFCKSARAASDPRRTSGTKNFCPYFLRTPRFMRYMKPAALVNRFDSNGGLAGSFKNDQRADVTLAKPATAA
ncbi:hypothetical protein [Paraburkholderia fungorum]|uniref:hypothetical protein n=1 Tax=Paraburkholderia fungorum TaxID=134537 RepID=UPI0038B88471